MAEKQAASWQWSKTGETQRRLLDAAQDVFAESGFLNANISDIVERAGSSTGSLYHHFGGKSELYTALWDRHNSAHLEQVRAAVAAERRAGTDDPLELFCVGARAFLAGSWQRRDVAAVFLDNDGPPGFERRRREGRIEWIRQNSALLGPADTSRNRITLGVLTDVIVESSREVVVHCRTRKQATVVADFMEELIRKLSV
ncbi:MULTISPECIES: TetR/AcrR family transcriptional regulator [Nocardiaceae]|uniref:TetR/AcrR family transcriptional regulator n=2 Tax=Rhodococcoides kroppenstedtii TaxID=293050 RepID=A0ABS7NU57_9NOCA|nr:MULTISPECIES: TetR/AcrR family transcriptional regulator [Rhodococcus]AMY20872.1 putative HTH-type transcriptional regulator TtgW [Rhodococcus sp. PBTS 1]MBT1191274.1 TetR/AcrR family transcriptional regulator [Rhodococcus kroppenstedtii]MBY6313440.1 TetR/AcrR family transcriptional regulator [Rhodococcus kroppenstedtii]MBY6321554.1 TetR/AcrR family transcriptional regulator [Rhodococcus kroppenstedtii]MBY6400252.1 TetR/AcrR family transcriptional regulator [Rhodococcus kroppenstedtii]